MKRRSPNLTPERVEAIVTMIRAWEGRLTWLMLIRAAEERFGCAYMRQALLKHTSIRVAYDVYSSATPASVRGKPGRTVSAALQAAMDRVIACSRKMRNCASARCCYWSNSIGGPTTPARAG